MKWLAIAMVIGSLTACGGSPAAPTPPANIAGSYNGTITASSTCSALPSTTRVLHYIAEVSQTGGAAQAQLLSHGGSGATVTATVSGQTVTFPSFSLSGNVAGVVVSVAATGTTANFADGLITGALGGTYQAASGTSCNAVDHQLQMRRCTVTCSGNVCTCA